MPGEQVSINYTTKLSDRPHATGFTVYGYDMRLDEAMIGELALIDGIDTIDYITVDSSTHILWDGIENSNVRQLQMDKYGQERPDVVVEDMYAYGSTFYKDAKEIYESYKDYIDPQYYDVDAFIRGEQVIYRNNTATMAAFDNGLNVTGSVEEDTLKVGDTVNYKTDSSDVKATVVGFIYDADDMELRTGSYSYEFIGSEQLGRKVAQAANKEYGYNRLYINMKKTVSFNDSNNQITNLFNKYSADFGTKYETKRQWENEFLQKAFIFGIVIAIIVAVYVVIYANIIATRMEYRSRNLRLLKGLGATDGSLVRMELVRCLLENVVIIIAIPLVVGFNYYTVYMKYAHPTHGAWIGYYDETLKAWSGNPATGAWQTTFNEQISKVASIIAVIVGFILLFAVAIQPVIGSLKKLKKG